MKSRTRVSNEKKNLTRLAGEFLVASRLTQRGYMVTLQWGATIGYDILVFDKAGRVAFLEVKSTASNPRKWVLQSKYAVPSKDSIPIARRFVCCVDLTATDKEPDIYVFPVAVVAESLEYFYSGRFSASASFTLALDSKPRGSTRHASALTVSNYIDAEKYREAFGTIGVDRTLT